MNRFKYAYGQDCVDESEAASLPQLGCASGATTAACCRCVTIAGDPDDWMVAMNYFRCLCESGAGEWTRTMDLLITNQLLYQLSYTGT